MLEESREAPQAVARQLAADADTYAALTTQLRDMPPQSVLTVARGRGSPFRRLKNVFVLSELCWKYSYPVPL